MPILPQTIKVGDLVEVQCSFHAGSIKKDMYAMYIKLRSICVLDRTVQRVSQHHENSMKRLYSSSPGPQQRDYRVLVDSHIVDEIEEADWLRLRWWK